MMFTWWFRTEWHKPVGQNMGCISRKHLEENQHHLQHLVESKMNLWLQLMFVEHTELRILPPTLGGSSWWEPWKLRIPPGMCCTETIWEKKSYLHSHWKEKPWPWPRDSLSCLRHWLRLRLVTCTCDLLRTTKLSHYYWWPPQHCCMHLLQTVQSCCKVNPM